DKPAPMASSNSPSCEGNDITLTASGGGTYSWSGPNSFTNNTSSPVINNAVMTNSGMYHVTVVSPYGCVGSDSTAVVIDLNPTAVASSDVHICEGTTTTLQGSGVNVAKYVWSPSSGLSNASIANPVAS